jgi:hypothetical protein
VEAIGNASMLDLIEQHRSPDGLLNFIVGRADDGDICLGFEGYSWHTHADILASISGANEADAVSEFVNDLLAGKAIIAVARISGKIRDVWIVDGPIDDKYRLSNETIEFRNWAGKATGRSL